MGKHGPEFYDDEDIFATYTSRRETRTDSPNETLEKPIFDELLGSVVDLRILDLGCGNADFGLEVLQRGARSYLGIDGSHKMIEAATQKLAGPSAKVICAPMESWEFPVHAFDLVTSRLALHYIGDIEIVFAKVHQTLVEGGRFIFSVEHPVITSCDRGWQHEGPRQDWIVDDYFDSGPRLTHWMGGDVIKYHRTIEDYFSALQKTGFEISALRESKPRRDQFQDESTFKRRKRIPLMLFFAAHRPLTT